MKKAIPDQVLVFAIDGDRFALPLASVVRVIRAVAVTPLPDAPPIVAGVVDVHGELTPVLSMRRRLGRPEREVGVGDHFVIAKIEGFSVAIVADRVEGLVPLPGAGAESLEAVTGNSGIVDGILKLGGDLVLLQNLNRFFALRELRSLDEALSCRESVSLDQPVGAAS